MSDKLEEIRERLRLADSVLHEVDQGEGKDSNYWIYAREYAEDIPYLLARINELERNQRAYELLDEALAIMYNVARALEYGRDSQEAIENLDGLREEIREELY